MWGIVCRAVFMSCFIQRSVNIPVNNQTMGEVERRQQRRHSITATQKFKLGRELLVFLFAKYLRGSLQDLKCSARAAETELQRRTLHLKFKFFSEILDRKEIMLGKLFLADTSLLSSLLSFKRTAPL